MISQIYKATDISVDVVCSCLCQREVKFWLNGSNKEHDVDPLGLFMAVMDNQELNSHRTDLYR